MPLCRPTTSSILETNEPIFWEDVVKCLESACAKRCGAPNKTTTLVENDGLGIIRLLPVYQRASMLL